MKTKDITKAKDPDLRATALARRTAIQTDTNLIVMKDGKLIRIPAQSLHATIVQGTKKST